MRVSTFDILEMHTPETGLFLRASWSACAEALAFATRPKPTMKESTKFCRALCLRAAKGETITYKQFTIYLQEAGHADAVRN